MPEPARIVLIEDVSAPERAEAWDHDGPFVDWLQARFPHGFGDRSGFVRRRSGAEEVPLEDWDFTPAPGEVVAVVVTPAAEITLGAILVNIAISVAISVALTALAAILFPPPEQPAFEGAPRADPIFSLSAPQNTSRLHQALPILYGELTYTLDLAAQPYRYYSENEQYVVILLCATVGWADVERVFAGETNVDDLPDGAVRWQAFGPDEHNSNHGTIGNQFGIWEDVVTSVDVAALDLRASTADQQQQLAADFIAPDTIRLYATGSTVDAFEVGGTVTVSGSSSNNAAFTIAAITKGANRTDLDVSSGVTDETGAATLERSFTDASAYISGQVQVWTFTEPSAGAMGLSAGDVVRVTAGAVDQYGTVERYFHTIAYEDADEDTAISRHTLRLKDVGGDLKRGNWSSASVYLADAAPTFDTSGVPRWTGPFRATKPGQELTKIEVDVVFPSGLYKANTTTGALEEDTVGLRFAVQEIDDDGNPIGDWEATNLSISTTDVLATGDPLNTPLRFTQEIDVPNGQYRIRARRTTNESTEASDQSRCVWEALKSFRVRSTEPVYGDVTLLALEFKASAGLSAEAIGRVRATARRRLPRIRDPYDTASLGRTRSPARAMYDLLCNPDYGLGLDPDRYLDLGEIRAARVLHSDAGLTFDHVFTDQSSAWDALKLILQPALAEPLIYSGKVTVRQEGPKTTRTMLFSPANVVPGSLSVDFGFRSAGDPDGVKVVWRDPASLAQREALWPEGSVRPTEQRIYGVTSEAHALALAKVRWRQRKGAQILAEFETGPEARIPRRGDRVGLSWPHFGWGDACAPVEIDGLVITLDRPVPDIDGGIRWAVLRDDDGSVVGPVAMTKSGPKQITLAANPGITLRAIGGDREPTHIAIGKGQTFLLDLIVDEVALSKEGGGRITATGYLESAYDGTLFEAVET